MARKETAIWLRQRRKILECIASSCATSEAISLETEIAKSTVKVHMSQLLTMELVHIGDWQWFTGSVRATRMYRAGTGKDAAYPSKPLKMVEQTKVRKKGGRRDWLVAAFFGEYQRSEA